MAYAAFPFNGNDSNVNFFSYWLLFIGCWLLSPFATTFLRSGQAENFVRPENKFLVPCAQNPSFLLTMQMYEIFIAVHECFPNFFCSPANFFRNRFLFSPKEILNTLGVFPITPIVLDSVAESL